MSNLGIIFSPEAPQILKVREHVPEPHKVGGGSWLESVPRFWPMTGYVRAPD